MPLLAYTPGLSLVHKAKETGGSQEGNRERARTPLEISEIVVLTLGTGRPEGAPLPGFRLVRWQYESRAIHATYASPKPVRTNPAALMAGVERLFGKPRESELPLVYVQSPP